MQEILEFFFRKVICEVFLLFGSFRFFISEDGFKNLTKNSKIWFFFSFLFF